MNWLRTAKCFFYFLSLFLKVTSKKNPNRSPVPHSPGRKIDGMNLLTSDLSLHSFSLTKETTTKQKEFTIPLRRHR